MADAPGSVDPPKRRGACPSDNTLAALLHSKFTIEDGEAVLAHLDECSECRAAVALGFGASDEVDAARDDPRASSAGAGEPVGIEAGALVGRYVVVSRVGEGGMGVVYAAYDPDLDRKVALKVVRPGVRASAAQVAREARALASISHPNVVAIYDVGYWGEQVYLVMEFVQGVTLRSFFADPSRSSKDILTVLVEAGNGLAAAHRSGLVHRDVKPENIMVDEQRGARVTDFGLARALAPEEPSPTARVIAGTIGYMPPEQLRGERVDARSDQFAFAVVVAEALCGQLPFTGTTRTEQLRAISNGRTQLTQLKWTARGPVPAGIARAIARALDPDPARRFATLDELLAVLAPPRAGRWRVGVSVVVAAALVASGALALERRHAAELRVCRGAEQRLATAWSPGRAEAITRAFAALPIPYAKDVGGTVRRSLDAYATGWTRAYTESCEATRLRKEQTETVMAEHLACLDDRRRELDALVTELTAPTAQVAEEAASAVGSLASVESCIDPRTSRAHRSFVDPALNRRADALADGIARMKAEVSVGAEARAKGELGPLLAEAQSLGDARLLAEALFVRGFVERSDQDLAAAGRSFLESAWTAEASRDDDLVALARLEVLEVAANERLDDVGPAERFASETRAAIDRVGAPPRLRARLLSELGNTALVADDPARALSLGEEALRIDEREVDPLVTAYLHSLVGRALMFLYRTDEALTHLRLALSIRESVLGPSHPKIARSLANLGLADYDVGDKAGARADFERGLSILRTNGMEHGSDWTKLAASFASVECEVGDWEAGVSVLSRALAAAQEHPIETVNNVSVYVSLGQCWLRARRYPEARDACDRGLALVGQTQSPMDNPRLLLLLVRAAVDLETNRPDTAATRLEEIVAACAKQPILAADDVADAKFMLARALVASRRDPSRARALATEARAAVAKARAPRKEKLAEVDAFLARIP